MVAGTNRGQHAGIRQGEGDQLLHDSQNQCAPGGNIKLLEKAVQMRVDGVFRDFEPPGYARLWEIIKDPLNNLQFPFSEAQGAGNFKPNMFAEE